MSQPGAAEAVEVGRAVVEPAGAARRAAVVRPVVLPAVAVVAVVAVVAAPG